ncbi:hypothetical protein [Paracoccus lutimaris]|uniref:Uncharacterized protein n=1 Tax=Paracoccus lutimaris TaxID=1490030 RepID=A0A368YX85_9RHOB|nr:hypothetical protein DFP89_108125 [Paracoccus lutimaris]
MSAHKNDKKQPGPDPDKRAGKADAEAGAAGDKTADDRAAARAARQVANREEREARRAAKQAERAQKRAAREVPAPVEAAPTASIAPVPIAPVPIAPVPLVQAAAAPEPAGIAHFNILILGQNGRLGLEAVLFAASLRRNAPGWRGRLIVAEPQPEAAWAGVNTLLPQPVRAALAGYGAEILPFTATHFGRDYPYGNKIEALALLPPGEPFAFFDSDTLVTGDLAALEIDFTRPAASMRREGTWPEPPLYGPGYHDIWKSLYDRFGLDFASSLDLSQPDEHWERYLYFNAGWFLGGDPKEFGRRFLEYALAIRNEPGDALACQSLDPWLDQVALPLVIHGLGGGRPGPELDGLDGVVTCHYRNLSLLYARESEAVMALIEDLAADPQIAPLLRGDEAVERLIRGGEGRRVLRPLFSAEDPFPREQAIRHRLRREGLWFR